ncbi:MAG: AI-2E family transporter [Bacteroidota bacterium]
MFSTSSITGKNVRRPLQVILLIAAILYFGRALFIPLSFAVLISFLLYPVCKWLEGKGTSRSLAIAVGLFVITALIALVVALLVNQFNQFQESWSSISGRFEQTMNQLSLTITEHFGISKESQDEWIKKSLENLVGIIGTTIFSSGAALVVALIVPVYAALILYHRKLLTGILLGWFPGTARTRVIGVLHKVITTYYNFIKGMLVVYLIVGLLNSIGLLLLGIQQAFLFGFIASILTFIPYVGIMIASLLPITVAWLTKDSLWYPAGVIMLFAIVQYLEANLIFPMAVSARLKINTLVTLLVMFAGGILWGAAGMILFIPFAAIAKLIIDELMPGSPMARFMGNGE